MTSTRVQAIISILCALCLSALTALVLYNITLRFLFSQSPLWGEDVPKLLFVWVSFIGAGLAHLAGMNMRMMLLIDKFPRNLRLPVEFVMHSLVIVMLGVILYYSYFIIALSSRRTVLSTGFSDAWTYVALPIGAAFLIVRELIVLGRLLRGRVDTDDLSASTVE